MKTKLLLIAMLFASFAYSQTLTLGAGTSSSATRGPFQRSDSGSSSVFSRSSIHYSATELTDLTSSATISQINFELGSSNIITASGDATMLVYMRNTSATEVVAVDSDWNDDIINGATLVGSYTFNTSNNFPGATGFFSFVLDTPFAYTGDALEIAVDWDCSNLVAADPAQPNLLLSGNGSLNWRWDSTAHTSLIYDISSSSAPGELDNAGRRKSERVNTQIVYTPGTTGGGVTPPTSGQVIGEFPIMDGGLENQSAGSLSSQGSSASGTASTTWSISTTGGTTDEEILDTSVDARTGNYSAQVQLNADRTNARLQAPSTVAPNALATDTDYTVQFFYKSPTALVDENLKPGLYLNNTSGGVTTDKIDVDPFVADTWTKAHGQVTSGSTFQASNWAVVRIGGDGSTANPLVNYDDFVVYAGPYDDVAPNATTAGTYANNAGIATIGWTAPAGGVDGGGYVVIRYNQMPNADNDPNQNGIYEYGNTTSNGTGSLIGNVAYIGTDTNFTETYTAGNYYKIYAVDKAFNYSNEIEVSDATLGLTDNTVLDFRLYPNPTSDYINISSNDMEISEVVLFDILGKEVLSLTEISNNRLDISNLTNGVYFVKISANGNSITKKIIKK